MTKHFNLGVLLFVLAAAPVFAAEPSRPGDPILVSTADLDLGSESGKRTLDRRITRGVDEVCGTASSADLSGGNAVRRCHDQSRAAIAKDRDRLVETAGRRTPISIAAVR